MLKLSNTINDLILPSTAYVDVYTLTGIAPGTSLILNNKSASIVYVQVRPGQPATSSIDGWPLRNTSGESWTTVMDVPAGSRVWVKGAQGARVFVQAFEG